MNGHQKRAALSANIVDHSNVPSIVESQRWGKIQAWALNRFRPLVRDGCKKAGDVMNWTGDVIGEMVVTITGDVMYCVSEHILMATMAKMMCSAIHIYRIPWTTLDHTPCTNVPYICTTYHVATMYGFMQDGMGKEELPVGVWRVVNRAFRGGEGVSTDDDAGAVVDEEGAPDGRPGPGKGTGGAGDAEGRGRWGKWRTL